VYQHSIFRHKKNFTSTIIKKINFHVLAGMETILSEGGSTIHYWLERMENCDKHSLQPIFSGNNGDEKVFNKLLRQHGRNHTLQNNILWGVNRYAKSKMPSLTATSRKTQVNSNRRTTTEKSKDIKKFKEAMRDKDDGGNITSMFATDNNLNVEWKRKLDLIQALHNAQQNEPHDLPEDDPIQRLSTTDPQLLESKLEEERNQAKNKASDESSTTTSGLHR